MLMDGGDGELSLVEHARLIFEDQRYLSQGHKEGLIRLYFDDSPTVHTAAVMRLIDDPRAVVAYPAVVNRLRRLRDARARARAASNLSRAAAGRGSLESALDSP